MPLPSNMSFVEGAAIPIAGKTALESMRALNLKSGDTLFIAGASGAIGTLVIQLAATQKSVDYSDPNWTQRPNNGYPRE